MNTLGAILAGLLIAFSIIGLLVYFRVDGFADLPQKLGLTEISFAGITEFISAHWQQLASVITPATAIGGLIYKWYKARQVAEEALNKAFNAQQAQLAAQVQNSQLVSGYKTQIADLQAKVQTYENDGTLTEAQTLIGSQASQIKTLQTQLEQAAKTPAQMLETLWQGSNNKVIQEGGNLYRVIELVRTEIK